MRRFLITTLAALAVEGQAATYSLQRVSHYNAVRAQTDRTPQLSACGPTRKGQIALSRDLLRQVGCGARVRITVNGHSQVYTVNDTMHRRYHRTADIMVSRTSTARRLGISKGTMTVLRRGTPYGG